LRMRFKTDSTALFMLQAGEEHTHFPQPLQ
jgi:hypothetical protein